MTYQEALNFLNNLQSKGIRPGLGNIAQALAIFGFPQFQFPSVHLAGTNGKGSTASFITSVLIQAGYKVGLFISPHLHTVRERIQVGRIPIPKEDFAAIATEIIPRLPTTLTYFEFLTLMAFVYFASQRVDIAVIETGLGGRLDATNLIMPEVSVITNIGLEHEHWLGYTLKKITLEKAGIIKQSRPLVTGIKQKELLRIIKNVCRFKNAPLYLFGRNFAGRRYRNELYYYGLTKNLKGLHLGLMGVHQFENASLALATLELLGQRGFRIEEKDIREGLSNTFWPGRFEIVKPYPFMIVLDGAHNPDGMQALKDSLRLLNYKRLFSVSYTHLTLPTKA